MKHLKRGLIIVLLSLVTLSPIYGAWDNPSYTKAKVEYDRFLKYRRSNPNKYSMSQWKVLGHPYVAVLQETYYLDKDTQYMGNKSLSQEPLQLAKTNSNQTMMVVEKVAGSRKIHKTRTTVKKVREKRENSFQSVVLVL